MAYAFKESINCFKTSVNAILLFTKAILIAEAGVNHNGDINLAKQLIDVAAAAGADYVKFQTFVAKSVVTTNASKADYQIINCSSEETQIEMLEKLELLAEELMQTLLIY